MATITSSLSGSTVTYVITDQESNTITVTAPPPGQTVTFSGSGLADAQALLSTLVLMLQANGTSPRPQVLPGTTASFYS